MIAAAKPDKATKRWMFDASDDLAVSRGCWFDERRGQFVVDWLHDYLKLYEGECAGQKFECKDWQYDATMRLFGWVRESQDWGRVIRRFRRASIWVAKKNKKSPTLAAWCIYMFAGDNVIGQKCFPTAKNGNQIRQNVGRHIHEMIMQSDALMAECTLNKQSCSVFHEPTRSLIMPLSSENVQTQKATEGLNGSLFVDETHVVDKTHMRRLSRAGISRPEPLHIEVSTAGDEPESYGMTRFNNALSIVSGTVQDIETLAIVHAVPQDIPDEQIMKSPVKYGKMANPSWGHTVKKEEYLHDFNTSKRSISDFADFKKYRLNIWQQSSNPWLSIHDWRQCPGSSKELDLDKPTFGGLDLSRTTDLTALLLYQPGDPPKCYGHYWCPRQRAMELSAKHEIPILEWEKQGWITLNDDRIINRKLIHNYILGVSERFTQFRYLGYDPYNADDTVRYCMEELDIEMVTMRQGVQTLSLPTRTVEELVVAHGLDHSNDPVLSWMVQNTSVKIDENGNIKPVKTHGGVRKHIDGVVGLVMAVGVSQSQEPVAVSVFDTEWDF